MNSQVVETLVKFALRRGLTILGGSAASISDDTLTKVIGFVFVVANEIWNAWQAHKHDQKKGETVKLA